MASVSSPGIWRIWNCCQCLGYSNGETLYTMKCRDTCWDAGFSPMETSSRRLPLIINVVSLDLSTGQPAASPLKHPDWVFVGLLQFRWKSSSNRFSRSHGQALGLAGRRTRLPANGTRGRGFRASFCADGRSVITCSRDSTARFWDRIPGNH